MAGKSDDPYGDTGVSGAEEDELRALMESDELPPDDNQEGASTDDAGAEQKAQPEPESDDTQDGEQGEGDPAQQRETQADDKGEEGDADEAWRDFLAKHKDKPPEELSKLAFQQQKRANRSSYDQRQAQERLTQVLDRIDAARKAKTEAINKQREDFDKKIAEDPDEALREAHRAQLERQQQEADQAAEREEFEARAQEAVALASSAIPEFEKKAPMIRDFGMEMGFSSDELAGVNDGRMLVTLELARLAANQIKSGVIDINGRFLQLPQALSEKQSNGGEQQRRTQFSRQPARGTQGAKSVEERMENIANMSDADFQKLSDDELEALLLQE